MNGSFGKSSADADASKIILLLFYYAYINKIKM